MDEVTSTSRKIAEQFAARLRQRNLQTVEKSETGCVRFDVADLHSKAVLKVYANNRVVTQGAANPVKNALDELKAEYDKDPNVFLGQPLPRSAAQIYQIIDPDLRRKVRSAFEGLGITWSVHDGPIAGLEYQATLSDNGMRLTVTQYASGKLLLQGKTGELWHQSCDLVETTASPSPKDVVIRFLSDDDRAVQALASKWTEQLIVDAETAAKGNLGRSFNYVSSHDQRWFIAAECLLASGVPLPEYSPYVMPASKALEGFAKKLLADIGLVSRDHFAKGGDFGILSTPGDPTYKALCSKDRHNRGVIDRLKSCLVTYRHFLMHSDDATITRVGSPEEARSKVDTICKETREIFEYFDSSYKLIT